MQAYEKLEEDFSKWAKVENVVSCSSGSAALLLALEALKLPKGAHVILPDYTMIACARAVTMAGLVPLFVDIDPKTLLIDPEKVEEQLDQWPRPTALRAIMAVHLYGRRCNMDALAELADKYDLYLIEDLAEAHGIEPHPRTNAATYSFYANKIIAGEEGGAVAFRDKGHADLACQLRCLGFTKAHDYTHVPRGWNHRLSNAHASLIGQSLKRVETNLDRRSSIEKVLDYDCPHNWRQPPREVVWVYDLRIPGMTWDVQRKVVEYLRAHGIGARYGFKPMSMQEEYKARNMIETPHSYKASQEVIYLPVDPTQPAPVRAFDLIKEALAQS